jgi:hypothetical protein
MCYIFNFYIFPISNPVEKPALNAPLCIGGPCVCPIPCCCKAPLQHFFEYVSVFKHKQPILEFFGDDLPLVGPRYIPLFLRWFCLYAGVPIIGLFLFYTLTIKEEKV